MIAVVVLLGLIIYTATAGGSVLANMLGFVSSPCLLYTSPSPRDTR